MSDHLANKAAPKSPRASRTIAWLAIKMRAASRRLGSVPSLAYAIAYLVLIPMFAALYGTSACTFYHSTSQYERAIGEDGDALLAALRDATIRSFLDAHGDTVAASEGWNWDISTAQFANLRLDRLDPEEGSYIVTLDIEGTDDAGAWTRTKARYSFPVRSTLRVRARDGWTHYLYMKREGASDLLVPDAKVLFPGGLEAGQLHVPALPVDDTVAAELLALADARTGFPGRSSGSFSRMLYLSAVTITTLGYGDIVPVSSAARLFVGLESVLGIVLMGLFLNALAFEQTRQKSEPPAVVSPAPLENSAIASRDEVGIENHD